MHKENVFEGVTVLALAVNETESLRQTIYGLEEVLSPSDVKRILIYHPDWVTAECMEVIRELAAQQFPIPVVPEQQISADNAECLMHIIRREKDITHLMLWASDGEVAPEEAVLLVNAAKENPQAFVKFSRMMKGGSQPAGKSLFLKIRDRVFCGLARVWLRAKITDALFFGHVLFPLTPFDSYCLREGETSVFIEILNLFSRLKAPFIEFPVQVQQRAEAKSLIKLRQKMHAFFYLLHLDRDEQREDSQ